MNYKEEKLKKGEMIVRTHNGERFVLCERIKGGLQSMFLVSKEYTNLHFFVQESTINEAYYTHFNWGYEPDFIDENFIEKLWHNSIIQGELVKACAEIRGGVYPIYDLNAHNEKLEIQIEEFHQRKEKVLFCNSAVGALLGNEQVTEGLI
jgi:hypothetical protein